MPSFTLRRCEQTADAEGIDNFMTALVKRYLPVSILGNTVEPSGHGKFGRIKRDGRIKELL